MGYSSTPASSYKLQQHQQRYNELPKRISSEGKVPSRYKAAHTYGKRQHIKKRKKNKFKPQPAPSSEQSNKVEHSDKHNDENSDTKHGYKPRKTFKKQPFIIIKKIIAASTTTPPPLPTSPPCDPRCLFGINLLVGLCVYHEVGDFCAHD